MTAINLSGNSLVGTIPSDLFQLIFLTQIDVSDNKMSGIIPSEMGNLSSLSVLNIAKNAYNNPLNGDGVVPIEVCQMRDNNMLEVLAADCSPSAPYVDCTTNSGAVTCCNYCNNVAPSESPSMSSAAPTVSMVPSESPQFPSESPSEATVAPSNAPSKTAVSV